MATCSSCNAKVFDDDGFFCGQCGNELKKLPQQVSWEELRDDMSQESGGIQIWPLPIPSRLKMPALLIIFLFCLSSIISFYYVNKDTETGQFSLVPLNDYDLEDHSKYPVHAINGSIMFSARSFWLEKIDVIYVRAINLSWWHVYRIEIVENYSDDSHHALISRRIITDHEGNYTFEYEFMERILWGGEITFTLWCLKSDERVLTNMGTTILYVDVS